MTEPTQVLTRPPMSTSTPSRANLADVIQLISKAELPEKQKQDLRSAVRTVAKLVDADPTSIAADPTLLRRKLEEISPDAHGLSKGRWANIRSLLGKALALKIIGEIQDGGDPDLQHDSSTNALIRRYRGAP